MSYRMPAHIHQRGVTLALGPVTASIPDGTEDSSTVAPSSNPSSTSASSKSSKSSKTTKSATTSAILVPSSSSFPIVDAPSTTSSASSTISTAITSSITSTSTSSQPPPAAATSTAASSTDSGGTSPGLVALAVIACLAFVGAIVWVVILRRQHKQREWTFQQHQRIFSRFDKSHEDYERPNTSHTTNAYINPPASAVVVDDGKAWPAGTGASVITTGPSVVRKLDWDQGPDQSPQQVREKPKRKPVPPPKEFKKKTFSQYLPYLLPQNHSAEVIELGKAEQQVYQRPVYKPAG